MTKTKKKIIAFSIILQYILVRWISNYPELVESYYTFGIYQKISTILRYGLGWIPFSIGDLLYIFFGIYIIRWLFLNKKRISTDTKHLILDVLGFCSLIYFLFHLFWGLNYYRVPVHKTLQFSTTYSTKALEEITLKLINKANNIHVTITKNDTLKINIPYSKNKLLKLANNGYDKLGKIYPQFNQNTTSIKLSLFSLPLTYMGFSGYLNPFTNEAQIDYLIPKHKYPTTICHEKAHQLGYAAENEANFIGCLAAINSDDPYFQYSGYIFALRHCLIELNKRDQNLYQSYVKHINKGIMKNYQESLDFWDSYDNFLEPLFKMSYNSFLKANNQEKGIESYNYAVSLFVTYFKNKDL